MSKTKITLEVDDIKFFDAVQQFGQDATGSRLVDLMLTAISNSAGFRTSIACALYNIEIIEIKKV